jgi:hypothetical protein
MVWMKPGVYIIKAYFLGKMLKYDEEEYWSCSRLFDLRGKTIIN